MILKSNPRGDLKHSSDIEGVFKNGVPSNDGHESTGEFYPVTA
jgi:hypothetical protein